MVQLPMTINLWDNHIGDAGAKAIADAIAKAQQSMTIDLGNNHIGDAGAKAIAEGIAYRHFLPFKILNLGDGYELLVSKLRKEVRDNLINCIIFFRKSLIRDIIQVVLQQSIVYGDTQEELKNLHEFMNKVYNSIETIETIKTHRQSTTSSSSSSSSSNPNNSSNSGNSSNSSSSTNSFSSSSTSSSSSSSDKR